MCRNKYKGLLERAQMHCRHLLLTVTFLVLRSSDVFIVIVPVNGTVMQIKKVQSDEHFNIKNKS